VFASLARTVEQNVVVFVLAQGLLKISNNIFHTRQKQFYDFLF
jgi:hypothetical protein